MRYKPYGFQFSRCRLVGVNSIIACSGAVSVLQTWNTKGCKCVIRECETGKGCGLVSSSWHPLIYAGIIVCTCGSNKISVDSVPCDPIRRNHRNHKCGECCRSNPKNTDSNLAMIFPEFSRKKAKNMEFSTTFLSR